MRSFIAIDCDENLKENISSLLRRLDSGKGNIRWIRNQGMHLTLKFLGDITDKQLEAINHELKISIKPFEPFALSLKGTGSFPPSTRFPKVLWVGVEDNRILNSLQQEIEQSLFNLGFPKEKRQYHPHLTLGRVKKKDGLEPILSAIQQSKEEFFGKMTVEHVTLFKSTLQPSGAEYTVLSEFSIK